MLCRERAAASGAHVGSGGVPSRTAVMIFFCKGQMRIQTLAAMMVPNMAPVWMT